MTRALVLGGGGPVGIAWESGLAVGLAERGIDLGGADLIVGTSAGSVVGARLALGLDLAAAVTALAGESAAPTPEPSAGIAELLAVMTEAAQPADPAAGRVAIGRLALSANTVPEDAFVAAKTFAVVGGHPWPPAFRATAVNARTGELRVWDASAGVDLPRALASSCAVPGIYPPVTIGDERYVDGGVRSPLNADLAAGHDSVVVVSCFALAPPEGGSVPVFEALNAQLDAELAAVRDSGAALGVVTPSQEFLELSGWGARLMDATLAPEAHQAGLRQAAVEADRLRPLWHA